MNTIGFLLAFFALLSASMLLIHEIQLASLAGTEQNNLQKNSQHLLECQSIQKATFIFKATLHSPLCSSSIQTGDS